MSSATSAGGRLPPLDPRRLSHAYILAAPQELAVQLAQLMLCRSPGRRPCGVCGDCRKAAAGIHPDLITVARQPDDKGRLRREIVVGQIRAAAADSVVLPNEADCKVYLISEADKMNEQAQNALLKLLEEPPAHVRFILRADNPGALLDTIRSRCIELAVRSGAAASGDRRADELLSLAADGDRLGMLRLCRSLEALSSAELSELMAGLLSASGAMLAGRAERGALSQERLSALYNLFSHCLECLRVNVGVKQVLSLVAARAPDLNFGMRK